MTRRHVNYQSPMDLFRGPNTEGEARSISIGAIGYTCFHLCTNTIIYVLLPDSINIAKKKKKFIEVCESYG